METLLPPFVAELLYAVYRAGFRAGLRKRQKTDRMSCVLGIICDALSNDGLAQRCRDRRLIMCRTVLR